MACWHQRFMVFVVKCGGAKVHHLHIQTHTHTHTLINTLYNRTNFGTTLCSSSWYLPSPSPRRSQRTRTGCSLASGLCGSVCYDAGLWNTQKHTSCSCAFTEGFLSSHSTFIKRFPQILMSVSLHSDPAEPSSVVLAVTCTCDLWHLTSSSVATFHGGDLRDSCS